ncbi:MAG TPA: Na+/H+ antiporter [Polyangiales bacterium]|nr:Na+/H+ antiporter [Polyangiales bacterium]
MHHELLIVLALLILVVLAHSVSARLRISFPILLVLVGLGISLIPSLPRVALEPELVFLVFLPPLLYEAAWFTSWREFKQFRGAISLQAVGLVFCTAAVVALVVRALLPGSGWALGFLLGGIVAPPDAIAASSVLHGLRVPRSSVAILEGESLVNDATSLIVVRFALAAITAGSFALAEATVQFGWVVLAGVAVGIALAHLLFVLHRLLRATAQVDTALTLLSPYLMYLLAEWLEASGVLAVVAGGLYLSARADRFLEARARVYGGGTWATVVFVLNGLIFILIGLQLPAVSADLGAFSLVEAVGVSLVISVAAIAVRIAWTFPAAYLSSYMPWASKPPRVPDWKLVTLVAWAGMRGVVSLAAALALPAELPDGSPFPERSLLVFVTFVVILVTLVAQGLSLPWLVRRLRFALPDDVRERRHALDTHLTAHAATLTANDDVQHRARVAAQRAELLRLRNVGEVAPDLAREKESELDLELARLDKRLDAHRH